MEIKIEIVFDEDIGFYSVFANGEILMECLSLEDIESMTIREIREALLDALTMR